MLDFWFNLPPAALWAVLIGTYVFVGIVIHVVTFRSPLRAASSSLAGVAPPLLAVIGLMFGLLTGFLAADISARNNQADRAVGIETSSLYEVRTLSIAVSSDLINIRDALRAYVQSVLKDEWPQMSDFGRNTTTEAAYGKLLHEVAEPRVAQQAGQTIQAALLHATSQVAQARAQRLAAATDPSNSIKWITVLVLAAITQVAIGLVHVERPRAQLTAITLFTSALVVALGLMAMQEWPFEGPLQVTPAPLQEFLDLMNKSPLG